MEIKVNVEVDGRRRRTCTDANRHATPRRQTMRQRKPLLAAAALALAWRAGGRACMLELRLHAELRLVEPGHRAVRRRLPVRFPLRLFQPGPAALRHPCGQPRQPRGSERPGDPADDDQPQLRARLRLQPERRLGRQPAAAVFQPLPHDDRGGRHRDLDVAHAEHRRRAPRRPLSGIDRGPQHRRAVGRQVRDRQLRQQFHRRAAGRASRSIADCSRAPGRRICWSARSISARCRATGTISRKACCSSRSIRGTAFVRAPDST